MSYFNTSSPITDTTYSSAFPPLQSFPWTVNNNKKSNNNASSSSTISSNGSLNSGNLSGSSSHTSPFCFFQSLAPPKFPSYLKYTVYADIVLQQYNDRKSKKPTKDIDLRLPQYWNKVTKSRHSIQIGLNGYDLSYNNTGPNKKENESTTLHTNFPARPQCGVYYFEIRVLNIGQDGLFAIGFSRENHKLNKLPGCDSFSYGYHGYDGQIYQQDTKGTQYGPSFSSGDVIGCGINYASNSAFFTKNGVSLGIAFESIDTTTELLYPCVGLSTAGETITANFGQEPFVFDIVQYVKTQQLNTMKETTTATASYPNDVKNKYKHDIKADVDQLVLSYLLQQGYTQTATSLLKNIQHVKQQDYSTKYTVNEDHLNRNAIRKSIMRGCVDTAMEQTRIMYPGLLENDPDLVFQLKTRNFLDILIDSKNTCSLYVSDHSSDTDDDTLSTYSGRSRTQSFSSSHHDLHGQILYEEEEEEEYPQKNHSVIKPCIVEHINTPPLPVAASGRRLSWAAIAAPPSFDTTVVEEMFTTRRKSITRTRRDSICSIEYEEEDHHLKRMSVVRKAMNYGHVLQEEYQHDSKRLNKLMELFTLLAYNDPKASPMAHLLDLSQRDIVATELNMAIQKYNNYAQDSNLDLIYKQSIATSKELIYSGHGKASLLNMKSYFGN